ncbi:hypothetical protein SEPCBS57363_005451 [Sporothrix epigloea]|uniref:Chromosome transmission fidelity protein 8 n=1 Tax=Sporothrix epigloea TaxID=1892477 RepID=A0ABP0DXM5_9PEZI
MDDLTSAVSIHPRQPAAAYTVSNSLPTLLHTPAGLALLELQGTINLPDPPLDADDDDNDLTSGKKTAVTIPIGRLDFPNYDPDSGTESTAWMRRVHLYIGQHQRLTGEVKKLPRPLAVVRRKDTNETGLEIVELIHYKLLFSQRPEPMTESPF